MNLRKFAKRGQNTTGKYYLPKRKTSNYYFKKMKYSLAKTNSKKKLKKKPPKCQSRGRR